MFAAATRRSILPLCAALFVLAALCFSAAAGGATSGQLEAIFVGGGAGDHSCAITPDGGAVCWGNGSWGQLGTGFEGISSRKPLNVLGLASGMERIAIGYVHTCALTTLGGVKCWGYGRHGELGYGGTANRLTPIDVEGITSGVQDIAAGNDYSCALTDAGGVKCWGRNNFGQLGDGTQQNRLTPVDVAGLTSGVQAITTGQWNTCALTTGGGVKCWGHNAEGSLGDGTNDDSSTPVDVVGLGSGVVAVSAGAGHACALVSGGAVKCWGDDYHGQLGNGTHGTGIKSSTPVDVAGPLVAQAISTGAAHTCALTTGGGVECWGYNFFGQLGNGTEADVDVPTDVTGLQSGVDAIALAWTHSCAHMEDDGVQCWGSNDYGESGHGGTTRHLKVPGNVVAGDPPDAPSIASASPGSPSSDNTPVIAGTADASTSVSVYKSADCSGSPAATGTAAQFASPGITVTVPSDTTIFLSANESGWGGTSACSNAIGYVEDSTAPDAPSIDASDPDSPANDNSPVLTGTAEAGSTVRLYDSANCSGSPVAQGTAATFASPGFAVSVEDDTTTAFTAKATDEAGNTSSCSARLTYVEDSTPTAELTAAPNPVLTGDTVTFDGSGSHGSAIVKYEWDLDGNGSFETDTGATPTASHSYGEPGNVTVGVRASNGAGKQDVAHTIVSVRLRPPTGAVGVSIDDGDDFTNDPHVTIAVVWPAYAKNVVISNDGGFAAPGVFPVAPRISWTLRSSGPERLPKTVYVRFDDGTQTFTDDIILDETAPQAKAGIQVRRVGRHHSKRRSIQVRVKDGSSGVARVQVRRGHRKPFWSRTVLRHRQGRRSLSLRIRIGRRPGTYWVRAYDAAGNHSRWRKVKQG